MCVCAPLNSQCPVHGFSSNGECLVVAMVLCSCEVERLERKIGSHSGHTWMPTCPIGHPMNAKVSREFLGALRFWRPFETECDLCGTEITKSDGCWRCAECNITYCMACAKRQTSAAAGTDASRPLYIMPGDILLCGPDAHRVHHVILVKGPAKREGTQVCDLLDMPMGTDVWSCETVDTSFTRSGEDSAWRIRLTYISRDTSSGEANLIGDLDEEKNIIELAEMPVPLKVLMHPCRPGYGGPPFNVNIWEDTIHSAIAVSSRYSLFTALFAGLAYQAELSQDDYDDEESRSQLLEDLRERWTHRPICASVAIIGWQMYFELAFDPDRAVQEILTWMPLYCDACTPSALVKALTKRGWLLHATLNS